MKFLNCAPVLVCRRFWGWKISPLPAQVWPWKCCKSEAMAATGSPAEQDQQDRGTCLVWCFEHCFKAQHAEARRNLRDLAEAFGFDFKCEKKWTGLLKWLESRAGTVLLVADWREARPLLEELRGRSIACKLSTCVVTKTPKTFRLVCFWAGQLGVEAEILVSEGFSLRKVEELVSHHLDRAPLPENVSRLLSGMLV